MYQFLRSGPFLYEFLPRTYIIRHENLGDLGRIVVSEKQGMCHFSSEVVGDTQDPTTIFNILV